MNDDKLKLTFSIIGAFLLGLTGVYAGLPDKNVITLATLVALVMGGASAVGAYLGGYAQKNPRNEPRSAEQVLAAVKKSDLPTAVKAQVAPALAVEAAKPVESATTMAWELPGVSKTVTLPAVPEGLDPILFADCLAVTRFAAAPSLEAFRRLPTEERDVWRVYVAEVRRQERELGPAVSGPA